MDHFSNCSALSAVLCNNRFYPGHIQFPFIKSDKMAYCTSFNGDVFCLDSLTLTIRQLYFLADIPP
eukprot:UN26509